VLGLFDDVVGKENPAGVSVANLRQFSLLHPLRRRQHFQHLSDVARLTAVLDALPRV
jgi:hypothetical protein